MAKFKSWRDSAKPIIQRVILENSGKDIKTIRKALRDSYPFGQRAYHPYKIWCDEIRMQLKLKKIKPENNNPNQLELL